MFLKKILKTYLEIVISVLVYVLIGFISSFFLKTVGFEIKNIEKILSFLAPLFVIYFVNVLSKKDFLKMIKELFSKN